MNKKLLIEGMSCAHCVNHLKTALTEEVKGIEVLEINLEEKYAMVKMDYSVNHKELKAIIEELGFELKSIQ